MKMLVNISNHPSTAWGDQQKKGWEGIIDIPFPAIDPFATAEEISAIARGFFIGAILPAIAPNKPDVWLRSRQNIKRALRPVTFHVAGEFCFFYELVSLLKSYGAQCVVATSERRTVETTDPITGVTTKKVEFTFCQWREI